MTLPSALSLACALLNALGAVFASIGLVKIRKGEREAHRRFMLAGLFSSAIFLVLYILRMVLAGPTAFGGTGWIRPVYFTILATHTPLAALVVPFVLRVLYLAKKERFTEHKRLARFVFPVWMYVSTTGVLIYLVLRHWPVAG